MSTANDARNAIVLAHQTKEAIGALAARVAELEKQIAEIKEKK